MRKILKKLTVAMTASVVLISAFAGCVYDYNHEAVFTPPATPNMPYLLTQQTGVATAAQLMEVLDIAGLAFAFVDVNEGFVWTQSFGYADVASRTPVTEDTIFNIASTAKMFTAVAVMQLVEGGYLDLDTPVVYYLPEFRNLPHPIFGGNSDDITVRMLLTHTSGIHELLGNTGAFEAGGLDRDFMNNLIPLMQD
ncbi:MAG: beta-lactamase family protein, partial [Defluviitaleaceae bacterium]|nr:beta-lactamase family protein [Defluviitaleaceae bacterium]